MKSAEENTRILLTDDGRGAQAKRQALNELLLNAMKEGARRAAYAGCKHANTLARNSHDASVIAAYQSAILTTAEQWATKDL